MSNASDKILGQLILAVCVGKFIMPHEINMAEALVYILLALCVAGYWSFSAWLRLKEKEPTFTKTSEFAETIEGIESLRDNQSDLEDKLKEMQTKMNGIALRLGLQ